MILSLLLGLFIGAAAVIAVEGAIVFLAIGRFRRGKGRPDPEPPGGEGICRLDSGQSIPFLSNKQGTVWVLEPGKVPKINTNEPPPRAPGVQKNKDIVEVFPVKKYAMIKGHSLILSDVGGSQVTLELQNYSIAAVSASNLSSRKWSKKYPIRLESKNALLYNGSKTCYLYLDTCWEKESWCKALRLASCLDSEKLFWYAQLREEFHNYLVSLNAEYPSFLKPSALFVEANDRSSRTDASSSKVRHFLKKLTKKTTKSHTESKTSSVSSYTRNERKTGEKTHSSQDVSTTDVKSSLESYSSSNSLQDLNQPTSPTPNHLGNDEGTLSWNLLFSRLFFDAKRNIEMSNAIKARIQRALSNMRTPSYIRGVTCTGFDLGNLPPYIHKIRVLPMDLNEVWAVEVDIEYSGGIILDFETRIEVRESELQEDIIKTSFEPSSDGELTSDLLDGLEHYGNRLKSSSQSAKIMDNRDEEDKVGVLKQSKSSSWTSSYVSRWKAIKQSFADQVSQVPISLAVRIASLRGTLSLHIKPPPSDQLWYGFISMPEIDWNLESSIGDRKITNAHIALLIGNRIKAAIRETLVLPNCESICIPFMLAEKDDWVPRTVAPFIWLNQEVLDTTATDSSYFHPEEAKSKLDNGSKAGPPTAYFDGKEEKVKNVIHVQEQPQKTLSLSEELRVPLLRTEEAQEECSDSDADPSWATTSRSVVALEEQQLSMLPEDGSRPKRVGRRARMKEIGKKMGEKIEEKRRHIEERSRNIVEKIL